MAATALHADPDAVEVARAAVDTWSISFATELAGGETIVSATATLERTKPAPETDIDGFVALVSVVGGNTVRVTWTGSVLEEDMVYLLQIAATTNAGAVIPTLITITCVA